MSSNLWTLIGTSGLGAVAALKRDGRPQISEVSYLADAGAGLIRFSTTADRAKTYNLRRDPRASLYVSGGGQGYAVAEATAELTPVSADPHDATVEELIEIYRGVSGGEHPNWDEYRAAMVTDDRLVVRLHVERIYGWAPA
jgi:PPOX class probable F420-dependent enzyme